MGKNMKLIPLAFKHTKPPSFSSSSWPWPTCADPKAFSFRAENTTMNSIFVTEEEEQSEYIASSTESNSASESCRRLVSSTSDELDKEEYLNTADAIENVIRGVKSERLFFEPGETSSSIVGEPCNNTTSEDEPDSNSTGFVVIEMETMVPFLEFKESMKEMVEAHGLKKLDGLEELLNCYLRVNVKCNHGYIIEAFVELVTHDDFDFIFSFSSSSFSSTHSQSTTCTSQSPVSTSSLSSFSTSNCKSTTAASGVSSLKDEEEAHA